jgi:superoxide dismutase, Fe-Mn family
MAYTLPPLPYALNALEPHMDAQTVELHWSKHHQGYITKLNETIVAFPEKQGLDIATLNASLQGTNSTVQNMAGGHYNHCLYWQNLAPIGASNTAPFGELAALIESNFNSFDEFKQKFSAAAASRFASGWAFLTVKPDGSLAVHNTPYHDNPLMVGVGEVSGIPILTCDVWEHAYYLKYQNRRPEFVENWWKLVNWDAVVQNYLQYAKNGQPVPF